MKTVINEKTGEYTITFGSREELDRYARTSHFEIQYDSHIAGNGFIRKSLEIADANNKCLLMRFAENGTTVRKIIIPIEFFRQFDDVVHRAFVHLSNVMASE